MDQIRFFCHLLFPVHARLKVIILTIIGVLLLLKLLTLESPVVVKELERNSYLEGNKQLMLYYSIPEESIYNQSVTVILDSKPLTEVEKKRHLADANRLLKERLSHQYESYTRISDRMMLPSKIMDAEVQYTFSQPYFITWDGWFHYKHITDSVSIDIEYTISYEGEILTDLINIEVGSTSFSSIYYQRYHSKYISDRLNELNAHEEADMVILPIEAIFYDRSAEKDHLIWICLFLMMVTSCSLISYMEKRLMGQRDRRYRKIQLTYLINNFILLYQTGMTIQKSLCISVKNRIITVDEVTELHHDLIELKKLIDQDANVFEVISKFKKVFDMKEGQRFCRLIKQNLKQGDDMLMEQLEGMTAIMWDDRIRQARKESEKAGSKLVFPMLLIFVVIIVLSVVPTFIEIKTIY